MTDQAPAPGFQPSGLPPGICSLTTWREPAAGPASPISGNFALHVGGQRAQTARRRQALAAHLGVRGIQWLQQVHGTGSVRAAGETLQQLPEADCAWTTESDLALAVLTADCLPVVVWSSDGARIGVAHAGWRGLVAGVLQQLLEHMSETVPDVSVPPALHAWIGPAIGGARYQVGPEVAEPVAALCPEAVTLDPAPGRYRADLGRCAERLLKAAGVQQVARSGICTFEDAQCYSYRREGDVGRMATLIWRSTALNRA